MKSASPSPISPDLRQALCHTLLAVAFILLGVKNPFALGDGPVQFRSWMIVLMGGVVAISWGFVMARWFSWHRLPDDKRAQGAVERTRGRALNHAMISALALMLTVFSFLGLILGIDEGNNDSLLHFGMGVAAICLIVLGVSVRDVLSLSKPRC